MKLEATFKRRCEAISVDWRYRFQLQPFDPLPAEQLLAALGGEAVPPNQLTYAPPEAVTTLLAQEDWSAGIIRRHPLLIVYQPVHSPTRQQSNLMHELAHVLLEHPMVGFSSETGLPLRTPRHEDEATYLGGCLQIPRLGLKWAVARGYRCMQIAEHFGASESMVCFRGNMTSIQVHSSTQNEGEP